MALSTEKTNCPIINCRGVLVVQQVMSDSLWPCGLQHARIPCLLLSRDSREFAQTHVHWVGDAIQPSHPLSPPYLTLLLPLIFPRSRVFFNESVLHIRWPKYWSFSFNISPSNEYSGLISFSIDWFDLLAVQGTLRVFSSTTIQKHQSAISIHMSAPSWSSPLPPPPTIPTPRSSQNIEASSLCYFRFPLLSVLYKVVYIRQCYSISCKAHS